MDIFLKILGLIAAIVLIELIGLWLWQVLAVAIFGLPSLTFLQFIGLQILAGFFFGNGIRVNSRQQDRRDN